MGERGKGRMGKGEMGGKGEERNGINC